MSSRRNFLYQSTFAALSGTVAFRAENESKADEKTNGATPEPGNKPVLDIIDCHTHFYDPTRPEGVPWPRKKTPLYRTVLPAHLRAIPKPVPLSGTVIVEASRWREDNQWLLDLSREDPFIVGIVGNLDPESETFSDDLIRYSKNPLYRGIRVSHRSVQKLLMAKTLKPFQLLAELDLELDINGPPEMIRVATELSKKVPELRIVINHIGNIALTDQGPPKQWGIDLGNAAKHHNIYCKVSALVEGALRGQPGQSVPKKLDFYRPYLDKLWDAFGNQHLIYGSNWPVSDRAADYGTLQQIVLDYVSERGEKAMKQFFSLNALKAYRWKNRPGRDAHLPG